MLLTQAYKRIKTCTQHQYMVTAYKTGYGSIKSLIVAKNDNRFEMQWDHLNVKGKCFTAKIC